MKHIYSIIALFLCVVLALSCTDETDPATIALDKTEINSGFKGEQTTIGVKCNRDWSASSDVEWITMKHSSETAFEAASYILVTVLQNDDVERTGTITITSDGGDLVQTVLVKQSENTEIIRTGAKFVEYLNLVAAGTATDSYKLGADIDLSGLTLPEIQEFQYVFNGQGHSISNWTTSAGLCNILGANGVIQNLEIDASCKLSFPEDATDFGFIAAQNKGTIVDVTNNASVTATSFKPGYKGMICGVNTGSISGCANNGDVSLTSDKEFDEDVILGGITGTNLGNGKVHNCDNTGSVSMRVSGSSAAVMVAGVIGFSDSEAGQCSNKGNVSFFSESAADKSDGKVKSVAVAGVIGFLGWEGGDLTSCVNEGAVTFMAGYSLGVMTFDSATKFATNVGGVVGFAHKCSIGNCNNSGKITSDFVNIDNPLSVYQTTARQSVGGVVASPWGKVSSCNNTGDIVARWVTSAHNETLKANFVGQIGGVAGGDYNSDCVSSSIDHCNNHGNLDITFDASGSNSTFGGIVGWGGKESSSGVNVVNNCVNAGSLTLDGFSKSRIGGISGCQVTINECKNTGEVYLKGGLSNCSVGGVCGFGNFHNITNCESYGTVKSDVLLTGSESSAAGGLGGLLGAVGNTAVVHSGCKINCAIDAPSGTAASMLIGVIGNNKPNAKTLSIGTADAPMMIKGTFNGVALTADNYTTYMTRPDFKLINTGITFNVKYGE